MNLEILQETFTTIRLNSAQFAAAFYQNLFTDCPKVKSLFSDTDIKKQERKLMTVFVVIISNLHNVSYLKNLLKNLGKRHLKYGVIREHYHLLGETMLKTLEYFLQDKWTAEVEQAWKDAYQTIVNLMLEGAKDDRFSYDDRLPHIPSIVEKLRAEAIAQKYLRDGRSINLVKHRLLQDYYFKELEQKIGRAETMKIVSDVVKKASQKERNYNKVKIS